MISLKQYSSTPATVEALIEAIRQLASPGETKAKEAISGETSNDTWQFDSKTDAETLNDFAADGEFVEASPLPLSDEQYLALIQASFPASKKQESKVEKEPSSEAGAENFNPLLQRLSALSTEDDHKPSASEVNNGNERVFTKIESGVPATLEEVLAAIVGLREYDEATILEMVSEGRMDELFPFELRPLNSKRNPGSPFPSIDELTPAIITKSRS